MPDFILFIALLFWAWLPALAVTHPLDPEEPLQLIYQLEMAIKHYAETGELDDVGEYHFNNIDELFLFWIDQVTTQPEQVRINRANSCGEILFNGGLLEQVASQQMVLMVDQLSQAELDIDSFIQLTDLINLCTTHILQAEIAREKVGLWMVFWPASRWLNFTPTTLLLMLVDICQCYGEDNDQDLSEWLDTILASLAVDQQRLAVKHLVLAFSATNPADYLENLQAVVETHYECSNYFITLVTNRESFKLHGEQKEIIESLRLQLAGGAF
ncbi:hypothetical protein ACWJJH_05220 [Endozoicomonadaceae bacterium StTr2]